MEAEEFPASKVHLQPDLLGSFPADVCPDINGQFGSGQTAEFSPSGRGEGAWQQEIGCSVGG